jgi:hypothetical protein
MSRYSVANTAQLWRQGEMAMEQTLVTIYGMLAMAVAAVLAGLVWAAGKDGEKQRQVEQAR